MQIKTKMMKIQLKRNHSRMQEIILPKNSLNQVKLKMQNQKYQYQYRTVVGMNR
ncbi:hypothetical protein [uncultured Clostridium sp.]|uniref:hypothetical protein n=1 Tax=uncultured Clostridium sp. TaxID=59620 RepID=UPI0025E69649|nr:hypothetical protein [uncultured Clostridium sp.]